MSDEDWKRNNPWNLLWSRVDNSYYNLQWLKYDKEGNPLHQLYETFDYSTSESDKEIELYLHGEEIKHAWSFTIDNYGQTFIQLKDTRVDGLTYYGPKFPVYHQWLEGAVLWYHKSNEGLFKFEKEQAYQNSFLN